jgi:hypothetical protein
MFISPEDVVSAVRRGEVAAGPLSCERRLALAAIAVLGELFGSDWIDAHILHSKEGRKGGTFIHPPVVRPFDTFKMGDRIVALAEHLMNLQEIEGYESCLTEIRGGAIESGFAKLVAAALLRRRNIPFRFVVPSGQLGHDYDAEAIIGATVVPIEMKAKVEGKAPSSTSIGQSLKRARRPLSKNSPN